MFSEVAQLFFVKNENFGQNEGNAFLGIIFLGTFRTSLVIFEFWSIFENFKKVENRC
jgi:hypothetical protein